MKRLAAPILATLLIAAACSTDAETTTAPAEASAAPSSDGASDGASGGASDDAAATGDAAAWPFTFVADQVDGGTFDAGDYEGQDLVLWFWAPW